MNLTVRRVWRYEAFVWASLRARRHTRCSGRSHRIGGDAPLGDWRATLPFSKRGSPVLRTGADRSNAPGARLSAGTASFLSRVALVPEAMRIRRLVPAEAAGVADSDVQKTLLEIARVHVAAGWPHVAGDYAGAHWPATFARSHSTATGNEAALRPSTALR